MAGGLRACSARSAAAPRRARRCGLRQLRRAAQLTARMYVFEIIIALLLAGAGLAALSRRIGTPYPAMVALAGAALALVPARRRSCSIPSSH